VGLVGKGNRGVGAKEPYLISFDISLLVEFQGAIDAYLSNVLSSRRAKMKDAAGWETADSWSGRRWRAIALLEEERTPIGEARWSEWIGAAFGAGRPRTGCGRARTGGRMEIAIRK
jgi:hypothetical protein